MSLTKQFQDDPKTFLQTMVVMVPGETDAAVGEPKLFNFELKKHGTNSALLVPQTTALAPFLRAYYLPWKTDCATTMDLGDKADFFFTSHLTNCRFSILADDPKKPKVAHVAGTGNPGNRNEWEKTSGFVDKDSAKRARRFSVSGGLDPAIKTRAVKPHMYLGQERQTNQSSAFVFGERVNGTWEFHAQIVKGVLSNPSAIDLNTDLTILKHPNVEGMLATL
jgi:hypothetical protein